MVAIAALEEITWRGYVYPVLEKRSAPAEHGRRRPSFTLPPTFRPWSSCAIRSPGRTPSWYCRAGVRPGLGLLVARTGRLPVAIFSHVLFTWAVVIQFPLWRLLGLKYQGPSDLLHLFVGDVEVGVDVLHVVVIVEGLGEVQADLGVAPVTGFLFLGT